MPKRKADKKPWQGKGYTSIWDKLKSRLDIILLIPGAIVACFILYNFGFDKGKIEGIEEGKIEGQSINQEILAQQINDSFEKGKIEGVILATVYYENNYTGIGGGDVGINTLLNSPSQ